MVCKVRLDLPSWRRVRSSSDFRRIMTRGRAHHFGDLVVVAAPNRLQGARLGISIRRTVAGAVGRNLLKRWIREAFRTNRTLRELPVDMVVVARRMRNDTRYRDIAEALGEFARRWRGQG